ncbi:MAG: hypothetical protein MRY21_00580 [Simkaniaceae bacterium]|nr:hypothetical protein [Simkaniaceae bacterium]
MKIAIWVTSVHVFLVIVGACFLTAAPEVLAPPKPIAVRETVLVAKPPPPPPRRRVMKKKKVVPTRKKARPSRQTRRLLADLDASLAQIEKASRDITFSKGCHVPDPVEIKSKNVQPNVRATLAKYFSKELEMPEIGDVTLTISVQPNGKIAKINLVSSQNDHNREYLMRMLKRLSLPYLGDEEISLTITFRGDG